MLRLGVLVVVLIVATVLMLVVRDQFVRPALRRKRLAELEDENRRLDQLLEAAREKETP